MAPRQQHRRSPADEALLNVAAAGLAGFVQPLLFNPLDVLRVRWQMTAKRHANMHDFLRHILRDEGFARGLYFPGQPFNSVAVCLSQGLRIGFYPSVRDALLKRNGHDPKSGALRPDLMALAGLISGTLGYYCAAPAFLLKTRAQAAVESGVALEYPTSKAGWMRGSGPLVLRGALLTAGNMMGYDATKTALKRHRVMEDGWALHATAACTAGVCAATLSAPADVVQTRMQMSGGQGALACVRSIATGPDGPLLGFFRGWGVSVARLMPTFVCGMTIYEQARVALGLRYF